MCVAIFPLQQGEVVKIQFALECILLRHDGTVRVQLDLLMENVGTAPVSRFRILLPEPLVNIREIMNPKGLMAQERVATKLREKQTSTFQLQTAQLAMPAHPSNWPYKTLAHVSLPATQDTGSFVINTHNRIIPLKGYLKQNWRVENASQMDLHAWILYTTYEVAVVDLHCVGNIKEFLQGGESMWIRLEFNIPAAGFNQKRLNEQLSKRRYLHTFRSPDRLYKEVVEKLQRSQMPNGFGDELAPLLAHAQAQCLQYLPSLIKPMCYPVHVDDWRFVCYRQPGLNPDEIVHRGKPSIVVPDTTSVVELPPEAEGCRLGGVFSRIWRRMRPQTTRRDTVDEFFFGGMFPASSDPADCLIEFKTEASSRLYPVLTWISLVLNLAIGAGTVLLWFRKL